MVFAVNAHTLPEVTVTAPAASGGESASEANPTHLAPLQMLDVAQLAPGTRVDQAVIDAGWAQWDANTSNGLAQGLVMRGFGVTNQGASTLQQGAMFLNGHPDIAWRFARDAATVETVQRVGGHDATFLGSGMPGGAVLMTSKAPTGQPFTHLQAALSDAPGGRFMVDAERHVGPLQLRAVLAADHQSRTVEGVKLAQQVGLLSTVLPYAPGSHVRWDVEYHANQSPFSFGTVYAGGRFWLDQGYVDANRASADRNYRRSAMYWQHAFSKDLTVKAHAQWASTQRDETLLGAYSILTPTSLSGYYRTLQEHNQQTDLGVTLQGKMGTGEAKHMWQLAWQRQHLGRQFNGPQNIGGFTLDLVNPAFPADLSKLKLSPRAIQERYAEQGVAAAWRTDWGPWQLRAGLRHASFEIDSISNLTAAMVPVARQSALTHAFGVSRWLGERQQIWLTHGQSFMPNRGQLVSGDWLPPRRGGQWEVGWAWLPPRSGSGDVTPKRTVPTSQRPLLGVTLFDITQSSFPVRDPANADFYINMGEVRSTGVELQSHFKTGPLQWTLQWSRIHARTVSPTTAGQGPWLPGVAALMGSARVQGALSPDTDGWLRLRGVGKRPGDSTASFTAPGYVMVDAGVGGRLPFTTDPPLRWGLQIDNLFDRSEVRALNSEDNVWQAPRRQIRLWVDAKW